MPPRVCFSPRGIWAPLYRENPSCLRMEDCCVFVCPHWSLPFVKTLIRVKDTQSAVPQPSLSIVNRISMVTPLRGDISIHHGLPPLTLDIYPFQQGPPRLLHASATPLPRLLHVSPAHTHTPASNILLPASVLLRLCVADSSGGCPCETMHIFCGYLTSPSLHPHCRML